MSTFKTLSKFFVGDMTLHYLIDENQQVEWLIYPTSESKKFCLPEYQRSTYSMVQAKIWRDAYDKNFSNGSTMFNSQTARQIKFLDQKRIDDDHAIKITTKLIDAHKNVYFHQVLFEKSSQRLKVWTEFVNGTDKTETLEFLASFVLNSISPFYKKQLVENLQLLRLRSKWSMEGRIEERPIEDLDLECSWKASGLALERFGQNGTMPVRKFFPLVGLKDTKNDTIWLAELEAKASWQLNAARIDDRLTLFGGLPDHDNGSWSKNVAPGATYSTPKTYLTVGKGDLLNVSQRLQTKSKKEKLPIIYNEWGTTWGHPNSKLVHDSVKLLQKHFVDTYVIDAGWYQSQSEDFNASVGDWNVNQNSFPNGLNGVVQDIHDHQMKAGIWFEFEGLGQESKKYQDLDAVVKRDNWPVTTLKRRFLDMTKSNVQNYLNQKVVGLLKENNFDYLKIDYNDSIGIGADGADSNAEGLQDQITATLNFIKALSQTLPELTIESCSSGGHRLTPAFIDATDLSSFSDAHETESIPIIAANELNIIPANKNLIWCTIHPEDSLQKLQYHLIATFLGRVCMSGDIRKMSDQQWQVIDEAFKFYQDNSELISQGRPFRYGPKIKSYQAPTGYQIAGFEDGKKALVLIHRFGALETEKLRLPQFDSNWEIQQVYGSDTIQIAEQELHYTVTLPNKDFCAKAIVLTKKNKN